MLQLVRDDGRGTCCPHLHSSLDALCSPLAPCTRHLPGSSANHLVQEAADGWAGYNPVQQRRLFDAVLVAVHEGAWQQLEARMHAALQLLPYLADA